jgi:hypothetical protein
LIGFEKGEKNRELIEKENGLEILIQLLKQSNDDDFKAECVGAISALLATRTEHLHFRFCCVEQTNKQTYKQTTCEYEVSKF